LPINFDANCEKWIKSSLVLYYEAMQQDFATHIHRLGTFLGRHLSPQAVAAIADYASFANMSVNPFTNREGNPMMDFSIARFLRKGVVGDWKNHFTAEQDARFKAVWEQKMGVLHYEEAQERTYAP
jgi:sulfotransferase family protein